MEIIVVIIIWIIVASVKMSAKAEEQMKDKQDALNTVENAYKSNPTPSNRVPGQIHQLMNKDEEELSEIEQMHRRRIENRTTSILERAIENVEEIEEDATLNIMEEEHGHSERVAPAIHYHPEDVIPENMLGSLDDLMIKGYEGDLCFERDFVGEGLDMISNFTVPSEVPEYSVKQAI